MRTLGGTLVLSPTDLVGFSGCAHQSHLDLLAAEGRLERPQREDPFLEVLRLHGLRHEQEHLQVLREAGLSLVEMRRPGESLAELRAAAADTVAAMRAGVDVVYQAAFFDGQWQGYPDFLRRVERPSGLGEWGYEVFDTKLSRTVKAGAVIQLAEYSRQVARVQGCDPEHLHLVLGDRHVESVAFASVRDYLETLRASFTSQLAAGVPGTVPQPVAACSLCDWRDCCRDQWVASDDLTLVHGVYAQQRRKLLASGVRSRTQLASLPPGAVAPAGMSVESLADLSRQARLQLASEGEERPRWELLDGDQEALARGLGALPAPSPGDIHFDIEGDPFAGAQGREYLLGWVTESDDAFHALWSHDAGAERAAFERFVDTVMAARRDDPGMHVYHYAAYEQTALRKLMARHVTREAEVDELLRGEVFVDLYRVVRNALRIGVDSYSLKKLEPLYMGLRKAAVAQAMASVVEYERFLADGQQRHLEEIRLYNEEDCRSLVGLRRWLEERRDELVRRGVALARPGALSGSPPASTTEALAATAAVAARLTEEVPAATAGRSAEQQARWLLASLLNWHQRDAKPEWWEYFARRDATDEELIEHHETLGGLVLEGVREQNGTRLHTFRFPPQETKLEVGKEVLVIRPLRRRDGVASYPGGGTIDEVDPVGGRIVLRARSLDPPPTALGPQRPVGTRVFETSLCALGAWVADNGVVAPGPHRAALDLLLRRLPCIDGIVPGEALRRPGEDAAAAVTRCIGAARSTCLAVQGPPGAGKTYAGAAAAVGLIAAGRRVGVTALSHRAVGNFVTAVCSRARQMGLTPRILQRAEHDQRCPDPMVATARNEDIEAALAAGEVDLVAGTPWLFARPGMAGALHTLVVDEAGQLSLASVLGASPCAANLLLLGDPQQLRQPSRGVHPPGADASALGHVLGEHGTIADERGIFLDRTWRMHPDLCAFVSRSFYDGRLGSVPHCAGQRICGNGELAGSGLRWRSVVHEGNRVSSEEEAQVVGQLVESLLGRRWIGEAGHERVLTLDDLLVVAPYNVQVATLRRVLGETARVGTVDRFQGQEGAVVIYSMASSDAEAVPRGLEFLFSPHRFNVAVSRARCLAVVVASPRLLEARCTRVEQIPMVNALCCFRRMAQTLGEVP